ncbi:tetratricopeptide repeat protein [Kordia sp.]|uniref:tetratricopeptide repeat protein n=1 Tax=Kordia sp. TaxID=1965332 RepID=UPI00386F58FE
MGFIDDALKDYILSVTMDEKQSEVYNSMGVCYAKKGNIDLALLKFNKAIDFNPKYGKAYSNKGNIYDMKRDVKNACENWKKAIALGYTGNQRRYEAKCKQH